MLAFFHSTNRDTSGLAEGEIGDGPIEQVSEETIPGDYGKNPALLISSRGNTIMAQDDNWELYMIKYNESTDSYDVKTGLNQLILNSITFVGNRSSPNTFVFAKDQNETTYAISYEVEDYDPPLINGESFANITRSFVSIFDNNANLLQTLEHPLQGQREGYSVRYKFENNSTNTNMYSRHYQLSYGAFVALSPDGTKLFILHQSVALNVGTVLYEPFRYVREVEVWERSDHTSNFVKQNTFNVRDKAYEPTFDIRLSTNSENYAYMPYTGMAYVDNSTFALSYGTPTIYPGATNTGVWYPRMYGRGKIYLLKISDGSTIQEIEPPGNGTNYEEYYMHSNIAVSADGMYLGVIGTLIEAGVYDPANMNDSNPSPTWYSHNIYIYKKNNQGDLSDTNKFTLFQTITTSPTWPVDPPASHFPYSYSTEKITTTAPTISLNFNRNGSRLAIHGLRNPNDAQTPWASGIVYNADYTSIYYLTDSGGYIQYIQDITYGNYQSYMSGYKNHVWRPESNGYRGVSNIFSDDSSTSIEPYYTPSTGVWDIIVRKFQLRNT